MNRRGAPGGFTFYSLSLFLGLFPVARLLGARGAVRGEARVAWWGPRFGTEPGRRCVNRKGAPWGFTFYSLSLFLGLFPVARLLGARGLLRGAAVGRRCLGVRRRLSW